MDTGCVTVLRKFAVYPSIYSWKGNNTKGEDEGKGWVASRRLTNDTRTALYIWAHGRIEQEERETRKDK